MQIRLYDKNNSQRDIDRILQVLQDGGTIIFPTDTAYALGCHALKERPIEKICRLKGLNPNKNRFSIICYDLSDISQYVRVDNATFKLMKRNLPGPFTFVLPAGNRLPKIFMGRKEVGIRVPDNSIIREICRQLEAPILATTIPYDESEDISYLTDPELIVEKFENDVDIIIDGGAGGYEYSTVVSCIDGEPEIIRQGKGILDEY